MSLSDIQKVIFLAKDVYDRIQQYKMDMKILSKLEECSELFIDLPENSSTIGIEDEIKKAKHLFRKIKKN